MEFFFLLPVWYQYTVVATLGLIVGSFLNVVIYRFNTGESLNGSSHCLSCGERLRWFELMPVFSYLFLHGRCRYCSSHIPIRYLLVEVTTAVLFALSYGIAESLFHLLLIWILVSVLVVVVVYDINHFIIPDQLVILLSVVAAVVYMVVTPVSLLSTLVVIPASAATIALAFYGGLWLYSKGRWIGFGDVKLVVPLGFMSGLSGIFSMIVLSFWLGAVISVAIIAWQRYKQGKTKAKNYGRQLTIKSEVPFAPFLILAFLFVFLGEVNVLHIFMNF